MWCKHYYTMSFDWQSALKTTRYSPVTELDQLEVKTTELVRIVMAIEEGRSDEYIDITAYNSTVYGLCEAYLDFALGTNYLDEDELEYLANRSGILFVNNENSLIFTLLDLIELWDGNTNFQKYLNCYKKIDI